MQKLLNINNYHYRRGGSDIVYLEHAALMEELGWKNAFFSMHHPNNIESAWSRYFVDEIEFGNAYSLPSRIAMAAKVVYSMEARKKLAQLLDDFLPDIAHLHCIYHHLSPAIIPLLVKAGVPTIMTAHDLKIACPAYKMLNHGGICERCKGGNLLNIVHHRCIHRSLAASVIVAVESAVHQALNTYKRHLSKVVVPSRFFIEKFVEWGWPRDKFEYIPNYVNAADFQPDYEPGDYFLYFGRLAPEKGVATLMQATSAAGVKLKIAGTGPEEKSLHQLAAKLEADIEFMGHCSGKSLHKLVTAARAVVLPSEWFENAPMSILESYAFGKPVIAANIGGIPEMVEHGDTGWLFESGQANQLAVLLAHIAALPRSAIAVKGRCARALVERRFNRENYARATLQLYAALAGPDIRARPAGCVPRAAGAA